MRRLTVGVHREHEGRVIAALQEAGAVELGAANEEEDLRALTSRHERSPHLLRIAEERVRLERAIETLESAGPEKNPVRRIFEPPDRQRRRVPLRDAAAVLAETAAHRPLIDEVLALRAGETAIDERLARLGEEEEMLAALVPFGLDLSWPGRSPYLVVRAGTVPAAECGDVDRRLGEAGGEHVIWSCLCAIGDAPTAVVTAALPDAAPAVDAALRALAFREFVPEIRQGSAEDGLSAVRAEWEDLHRKREANTARLSTLAAEHLPLIRALAEECRIVREREEAAPLLGTTRDIAVLRGWVRERDEATIRALCERETGRLAFCTFEPPEGDPPVAPDHPGWLAPFGVLTATFGTPRYDSVDPTLFLAPVLVITFGIMLGDAGYGLLLALIATLLLRGAGAEAGSVRDLSLVLLACGLSGTLFGVLMGGFFGDLLPRLFGVTMPFTLIEPLSDPIAILVLALGIGIAHLNLGLAIAAAEHLRAGEYREMLLSEGTWFVIQPCAAVIILTFFGWGSFAPEVLTAAAIGAAVGVAGVMLHEGPLGFFSLTGFLGDWLSYARILALALATGGIAMMINILAGMIAGVHPALVVFAALFAVGGHAANLVLQALGGFIHALRLQYVEFFGKFFRSGGRAFAPFAAGRRHTEVGGEEG
ncbi:hypothetical protein CUJ86_02335 [Methanofollis fontis]|uniref:A-type ATP synthase subunit I n=2 Tax=Methanofollis fontis TaxID=2052832 RepID=A0A483CR49_9EURY|nr:hypothetical protein CUJ86_02335 [Methanofollis fontis]